ncbi:hypothetical protein DERF_004190 [Dermatophagoides farinae]|uniref:Uncharacterized protein n=1 Tax=Dermatophagoides farinae TaxID=6954 RepID=A0A922I5J1_DERFA|nr:hypothetical protein DERF_004190 [Dermatophagoides farinae]
MTLAADELFVIRGHEFAQLMQTGKTSLLVTVLLVESTQGENIVTQFTYTTLYGTFFRLELHDQDFLG